MSEKKALKFDDNGGTSNLRFQVTNEATSWNLSSDKTETEAHETDHKKRFEDLLHDAVKPKK